MIYKNLTLEIARLLLQSCKISKALTGCNLVVLYLSTKKCRWLHQETNIFKYSTNLLSPNKRESAFKLDHLHGRFLHELGFDMNQTCKKSHSSTHLLLSHQGAQLSESLKQGHKPIACKTNRYNPKQDVISVLTGQFFENISSFKKLNKCGQMKPTRQ